MSGTRLKTIALLALLALGVKSNLYACATCYGASDSPLAQGMNWGIMVLLGFIFSVLVAVTSFFIYIARRAKSAAVASVATESKS
mgnify:FL=1